ncbi:unnamed protein product [Caenorhabditis angaria]|uniref:Secreted protein n=1 Tax=Caenorhabditis angaria TaxID=860376 RepID=A0A9P1N198_9PELO|nr:unnamed protein product [Caenorhabditis angaria]
MQKLFVVSILILSVYSMPVDQELVGGRSVPHPNSAAGQAFANKDLSADGKTGGRSVPHPNSAAGQALSAGATGGSSVPHPNSAAGQALSEKTVLEGGTQVKPWLKNQPNLANLNKDE